MSDYIKQRHLLLIFFLTIAVYLPTLRNGFIWDDDAYLTKNKTITAPNGLKRIWFTTESKHYYPLVFTTFWIEHRLWGFNPMGYHAVNIILHTLNALFLCLILKKLEIPHAWLSALIFALHPVSVESVAWITERKNVLSGLFYMLSILFYFHFQSGRRTRYYFFSIFCFIFALFSKTITCSLPVVLLLLEWMRNRKISLRDLKLLAPFFAAGLFMGSLTIWYERSFVGAGSAQWLGASGMQWHFSFLQRIIIAGKALWFYIAKIIFPYPLIFIYPKKCPTGYLSFTGHTI